MKKCFILFVICVLLTGISITVTADSNMTSLLNNDTKFFSTISFPTMEDLNYKKPPDEWDGEFIGAYGRAIISEDEKDFETYGYIAGIFIGGDKGQLYGKIFNLEEEEIGVFGAYYGKSFIIGKVQNLDGKNAPIIGFLLRNETLFFGRIMSLFGPAPHIIGKYWET
ncbi:MAG: hypothetical protein JSV67_02820 [Thermoplasmatales archaeon]|nr:MAG: hypothetical protein JSV67_02820 [Thermoplasmatales archaeon]